MLGLQSDLEGYSHNNEPGGFKRGATEVSDDAFISVGAGREAHGNIQQNLGLFVRVVPMPKNPNVVWSQYYPRPTRTQICQLFNPLSVFARCESAAYIRDALGKAQEEAQRGLFPTAEMVSLGEEYRRCSEQLKALDTQERWKRAAVNAAAHLTNSRIYFQQGGILPEAVRPVLYYYGGLSFLIFITSCLVCRQGRGGHGISMSCASDGGDFDRSWTKRSCFITVENSGDFPFFVDALTVAGFPSLFSGYRLHRDALDTPWQIKQNPYPLLKQKVSLDYLCNFDFQRYGAEHAGMNDWYIAPGVDKDRIIRTTSFLLDFLIVFASSSLARYYIPAWQSIVAGEKSSVISDVQAAYESLERDLPYLFAMEAPFAFSFGTVIAR